MFASPKLTSQVDLTPFNTLGLRSCAESFAVIEQAEQLTTLLRDGALAQQHIVILGGGSNVVLAETVHGVVLKMQIAGRQLVHEDNDAWFVRAGAGEAWHDFVMWTLEQGWGGLENLALIPGTVGAAPVQNIGAYGVEVAQCIHQVEAIDLHSGALRSFCAQECKFGYRDSIFKQPCHKHYAITAVIFRLPKAWQGESSYADVAAELTAQAIESPSAQQIAQAVIAIRQRKLPDPKVIGNAGSFFKNPIIATDNDAAELALLAHHCHPIVLPDGTKKFAAARLIQMAGWLGKKLGPVGMYEKHALILVNHGGACAQDVINLSQAVREDVLAKFHISLEPEPVFIA